MFANSCTKCGQRFETKNPKRVVCPDCLYPDRVGGAGGSSASAEEPSVVVKVVSPHQPRQPIPQPIEGPRPYIPASHNQHRGGPRPYPNQSGPRPSYPNQRGPNQRGPRPYPNQSGPRPSYPSQRGPNQRGPNQRGPRPYPNQSRPPAPPKKLLIEPEVLAQIEAMYLKTLPLPNPDVHEVLATQLQVPATKVFFAINLIRQKMKLPKMEFPKRKLAVTPDQLMAVQALYELYLPVPPIGIHKIMAKQLKMDEWRVHVAIGLIRKTKNEPRWNEAREDLPEKMKAEIEAHKQALAAAASASEGENSPEAVEKPAAKKRGPRAKKAEPAEDVPVPEDAQPAAAAPKKPRAPRAKKAVEPEA